jgi:ribonuclease T2
MLDSTLRRPDLVPLLIAALGVALPLHASAQALSCDAPANIAVPKPAGPSVSEPVRALPIGAYTLALSWSPQYCRNARGDASFQCGQNARFGFVLHGLWPDGQGAQWPQYCHPTTVLPPPVIREMLCTTPSVDLMQHEWAKHGTCGWSDPAVYFRTGRSLYQTLRFPDMMALSRRRDLTVGMFRDSLARANAQVPGLTASAIRVRAGRSGWLEEVWLCLDRTMAYARCGTGQQGGTDPGQRLKIWRGDTPPRRRR